MKDTCWIKSTLCICLLFLFSACSSLEELTKVAPKKEIDPQLTRPIIKKIWVEDNIVGDRYIMGHWEYQIERNSSWSD